MTGTTTSKQITSTLSDSIIQSTTFNVQGCEIDYIYQTGGYPTLAPSDWSCSANLLTLDLTIPSGGKTLTIEYTEFSGGGDGGGGGIQIPPITEPNITYQKEWARGSEVTVIITNASNITFNKELDGIFLRDSIKEQDTITLFFLISPQAELGEKTLELTIDGVKEEITIDIVSEITIKSIEKKILGIKQNTFYISLIIGVVLFFFIIIIATMVIDSRK